MYNNLVDLGTEELQRFRMNSSCRSKDVLYIIECVIMAGITERSSARLFRVPADCLEVKMGRLNAQDNGNEEENSIDYGYIIQSLRDSSFGLYPYRPLLGLGRFSTRQQKQRAFSHNATCHFDGKFREGDETFDHTPYESLDVDCDNFNQYDWSVMFKDPSRPLVVDVDCGMGVSSLGWASLPNSNDQFSSDNAEIQIDWSECNFIGMDLSRLAIRYAQAISSIWSLKDLNFVVDPVEVCLSRINENLS